MPWWRYATPWATVPATPRGRNLGDAGGERFDAVMPCIAPRRRRTARPALLSTTRTAPPHSRRPAGAVLTERRNVGSSRRQPALRASAYRRVARGRVLGGLFLLRADRVL